MTPPYDVFYKEFDPKEIINYLEFIRKTSDFNPTPTFFQKLEKSILKNGIRNPICVSSLKFIRYDKNNALFFNGKHIIPLKKHYFNNELMRHILISFYQGCSRLWVAQKHKLKVPAIISGAYHKFSHQCLSNDCIKSHFSDNIKVIYKDIGVYIEKTP